MLLQTRLSDGLIIDKFNDIFANLDQSNCILNLALNIMNIIKNCLCYNIHERKILNL